VPCDSLLLLLFTAPEDAWVLFMEAAFAMLYSDSTDELTMDSYQSIVGGPPARALLNLTGESTVNFSGNVVCSASVHPELHPQLSRYGVKAHQPGLCST
jgi:hypothetical protein